MTVRSVYRRGMQSSEISRATATALSIASSLGLPAEDAVVLHNSNKLSLRLRPADAVARVAPLAEQNSAFEVDLARRLVAVGCPAGELEPRVEPVVHERDGFAITFWTYYEPVPPQPVPPADYADALRGLHRGMAELDVETPHFTDRVESAQQLMADRNLTPALPDAERELLADTLSSLRQRIGERAAPEQLLHGEPHPGNLLSTRRGLLFIDLETCCRGPVEFDLAHAPEEVAEHYPDVDHELLRDCQILMLAMVTAWRWDRGDQLPNGLQLAGEWLDQIRTALEVEQGGRAARQETARS